MIYFEIIASVIFVILTTVGYRKSCRNLMLVASIFLLVGLAGPDFVKGFQEGINASDKAS